MFFGKIGRLCSQMSNQIAEEILHCANIWETLCVAESGLSEEDRLLWTKKSKKRKTI